MIERPRSLQPCPRKLRRFPLPSRNFGLSPTTVSSAAPRSPWARALHGFSGAFQASFAWFSPQPCVGRVRCASNVLQNFSRERQCGSVSLYVSLCVVLTCENCFFLNGQFLTSFGRLPLRVALPCGFTFFLNSYFLAPARPLISATFS